MSRTRLFFTSIGMTGVRGAAVPAGDAHNRLLKRIQAELLPKRAPAELLQRAEDYAQLAQALAATL